MQCWKFFISHGIILSWKDEKEKVFISIYCVVNEMKAQRHTYSFSNPIEGLFTPIDS